MHVVETNGKERAWKINGQLLGNLKTGRHVYNFLRKLAEDEIGKINLKDLFI